VSEIVLPLTFAVVLAVVFQPAVGILVHHRFKPAIAAGLVVVGLLALMAGVVVATVRGVTGQTDQIGASVDAALHKAVDALGIDQASLDAARAAVEKASPAISGGFLTNLVSGIDTLIGVASGLILGAMIMYYLLKDGTRFRRSIVAQFDPTRRDDIDDLIGDSSRILRDYGRGRTVMSAIVAAVIGLASLLLGLPLVFTIIVVNFVGGYIPYIGAFLGGGLAVIVALGDGGLAKREASSRRSPVVPNRPCNACSTDVYPSITTAQDTLHSSVACASISRSSLVAPGDSLGFPRIDAGCSLADPAAARQLSGWHKPTTNLRE
jgi:predicted PurR-regulated permease PerM